MMLMKNFILPKKPINSFKNNKIIKTKSNKIKIKNVNTLNLFFRQQIKRK